MLAYLSVLLKFFFAMCLLQKKPQDLPKSRFLLHLLLVSNVFMNALVNLISMPVLPAVIVGIVTTALVMAVTYGLLSLVQHQSRSQQTLCAMFGTDLIIGMPAIALRYWFHLLQLQEQRSDVAVILWIAVFFWNLSVLAHILRHALGVHALLGVIAAIGYAIIVFNTIGALYGYLMPAT